MNVNLLRRAASLSALAVFALACGSQATPAPKPLRVWAYKGLQQQLERWETAYTAEHPEVRFSNEFHGAAALMSGLYDGVADFALTGREIWPVDTMAYRWVFQEMPFGVTVATAGLNAPGQAFTPVVIVNASNPLAAITLSQLDAIYGSEHRAAPANIRTWGELGLTGSWASKPIHAYGFGGEDALGVYFRHDVLRSDFKPNPDSHLLSDSEGRPAAERIAAAVAADPYAIGYTAAPAAKSARIVPITGGNGVSLPPAFATIADHSYPMARSAWLFFRRSPDKPLNGNVEGFVRFILSAQGQALVQPAEGYIPLSPKLVSAQIKRLEAPVPPVGVAEDNP